MSMNGARHAAQERDYSTLLGLFIQLVDSQAGRNIPAGDAWLNDAQLLATKLFQHLVSMQSLANGATVDHKGAHPGPAAMHLSMVPLRPKLENRAVAGIV